jgi:chemotaxis protein CheD
MLNNIAVGLGEIKMSCNSQDILVAYGLGSCLGIGMFDPVARVAALLHAILPTQQNCSKDASAKYVDSGIRVMLEQMTGEGVNPRRLIIRVAGGANMLIAPGFSQVLNIGTRNIEAAQIVFESLNLHVTSHEVGGHAGRTVRFYVADGRMTVRTIGNQEREI